MWAENTSAQTFVYEYVWSKYFCLIYLISSQSSFQGYSNSLRPEREMTPLFLIHFPQRPKGRCTSPPETSNSCLPVFSLSALSASVWPLHTHKHRYLCELSTVGVWAWKKKKGNGMKEIKKKTDVARWSHYGSHLMCVSVRDIVAGGHTMESPHNSSLQSFLKIPFTDPNKLRSWFMAKLNKGVNLNDKGKSIFQIYIRLN